MTSDTCAVEPAGMGPTTAQLRALMNVSGVGAEGDQAHWSGLLITECVNWPALVLEAVTAVAIPSGDARGISAAAESLCRGGGQRLVVPRRS